MLTSSSNSPRHIPYIKASKYEIKTIDHTIVYKKLKEKTGNFKNIPAAFTENLLYLFEVYPKSILHTKINNQEAHDVCEAFIAIYNKSKNPTSKQKILFNKFEEIRASLIDRTICTIL